MAKSLLKWKHEDAIDGIELLRTTQSEPSLQNPNFFSMALMEYKAVIPWSLIFVISQDAHWRAFFDVIMGIGLFPQIRYISNVLVQQQKSVWVTFFYIPN